jgi:hypothetical protein
MGKREGKKQEGIRMEPGRWGKNKGARDKRTEEKDEQISPRIYAQIQKTARAYL